MAGTQFRVERGRRLQLLMSTIDHENVISPNCNVIKLLALYLQPLFIHHRSILTSQIISVAIIL